ncbi:MAG: hypothetical protein EBS29_02980 [Chloroflexia bacterium]|nr:hypothetical protein [Chloroflexia bacterium]
MQRITPLMIILMIIAVSWPLHTSAHGIIAGGSRVLDVQAGSYPLRVEVVVPTGAPAVLTAKVWPQRDLTGAVRVTLTATQQDSRATVTQQIAVPAGARMISVFDLTIPQTGTWELRIQIQDATEALGLASVPITIYPTIIPPLTIPMFLAVAMLALVLFSTTIWPDVKPWVRLIQAHGFTASLSITVVIGVMMVWPNLRVDIPTVDTTSRPYVVTQVIPSHDAQRNVDQLKILLHDGSTGLPVDDVVLHHQALMHLVAIDPVSHTFLHIHPARIAPGQYIVDIPAIAQGTYDVAIEIERVNSGSQVTHQLVQLGVASAPGLPAPATLPAKMQSGAYMFRVETTTPPRVGVPVELQVTAFQAERPVPALDFWLGMRGHMIVRNSDGAIFGHIHAVGAMNEAFQPVSAVGNQVAFVYAFPTAETYAVWVQLMIDGNLITLPVQITVLP